MFNCLKSATSHYQESEVWGNTWQNIMYNCILIIQIFGFNEKNNKKDFLAIIDMWLITIFPRSLQLNLNILTKCIYVELEAGNYYSYLLSFIDRL